MYDTSSSFPSPWTKIYILNVIEWADDDEEFPDDSIASTMEEKGRRMLTNVVVPLRTSASGDNSANCIRIVKLGDPSSKIVEMAKKLNVDIIVMGSTGLGNAKEIGHVSRNVLKLTSLPVVFLK
jgi:nucleotide-binding universal stress UspA family protein